MTINDQHYITKVLEGDSHAFAVLVDRYKDLVFTLALTMTKNREEAEEVAQDVFIKIYKHLATFKGDSKFSTWIYKVTYNTCLDRIKKLKRLQNTIAIDAFTEHEIKTIDNALFAMEIKERNDTIQNCLNALPAEDRFMLTWFYYEDQSLDEIAKVMDIKPNHVKVKLFRSRKKLATILRSQLEPEILQHYER
ncbi:sigma-70 family RNA polymerase sigma factor [Lacinutrix neustonica]|uniref:RNA polymerase sigma factor n=1 Tax=Lacinutrix neustonica TaxID=2980107 RepID=A0A9E8SF54_9FLAO|nr:sigma-70 family RNA polymerase sigma factor [Lacinutrix neustonica]WAC03921.1 sigma-70 family RNA polymerase sigma factor [Lacinutrix neustonica]